MAQVVQVALGGLGDPGGEVCLRGHPLLVVQVDLEGLVDLGGLSALVDLLAVLLGLESGATMEVRHLCHQHCGHLVVEVVVGHSKEAPIARTGIVTWPTATIALGTSTWSWQSSARLDSLGLRAGQRLDGLGLRTGLHS